MSDSKSKDLKIDPTPFKSSYLAIPPSPCSPRTPLALGFHAPLQRAKTYPSPDTSTLPLSPLKWLWQCHQCHRIYALGVTARCLEDGHHFCAGSTTVKTWRKPGRPRRMKRHRACGSEFDYQGWKTWGRWRRSGRQDSIYDDSSSDSSSYSSSDDEYSTDRYYGNRSLNRDKTSQGSKKDCWNTCDYPNECRWGRRFGVHTPVTPEFPSFPIVNPPPPPPPPQPTALEGTLKPENCKEVKKEKKADRTDFWGALVASARRRKSVPPSSPLASVKEEPELESNDGYVFMANIDPALLHQ